MYVLAKLLCSVFCADSIEILSRAVDQSKSKEGECVLRPRRLCGLVILFHLFWVRSAEREMRGKGNVKKINVSSVDSIAHRMRLLESVCRLTAMCCTGHH